MIPRRASTALLIGLLTLAHAQDAFDPARTYVLGEKDVYGLSMKMSTAAYDVGITGKLTYTTRKVYPNGDADLESQASDMVINALGQELKQPTSEPRMARYSKFGAPLDHSQDKSKAQPKYMSFLTYRVPTLMKLGVAVKVSEKLGDEAKTEVKGTAKLESLTDGIAKVVASLDVSQAKGKKPMHIDSISYIDVKSSKLNRVESHLTNVDASELSGTEGVGSITVVIERQKS